MNEPESARGSRKLPRGATRCAAKGSFSASRRPLRSYAGCNYLGGIGGLYLPRGITWWVRSSLSGGSIRGTHFLGLILLNQSIASLGHAGALRFIRRSGVKIGVAKGDVGLSLLNESRNVRYSSTICSDPGHFGGSSVIRCYATRKHVEQGDRAEDRGVA
jgi:hypothetical protein